MAKRGNHTTGDALRRALPEECFWVHNGPILSDMKELAHVLRHEMSKEQYEHHVNKEKNDFADWVEHTLHDSTCAKELRSVKRKDSMAKKAEICLKKHI